MSYALFRSVVTLTLIITPLFFWTLTPNFFSTPKELFLTLTLLFLVAQTAFNIFKDQKLIIPPLSQILPLLLFALSLLVALIVNPEGRPEAISSKASTLLSLTFFSLLLIPHVTARLRSNLTNALISIATLLSLHSLLSLTTLSKSPYLPLFMQQASFTPTGSYLTTLVLIILGLSLAFLKLRTSTPKAKTLLLISIFISTIATVAIIAVMLPGGSLSPTLVPYLASWSIALDALKSLRTLLFGIGLSNYSLLYSAVKPLSLNATSLWSSLPQTAPSEFLTILPTAGIIPTLSLLYLYFQTLSASLRTPWFIPALILTLAFFLIPSSLSLYLLLFVFYAVAVGLRPKPSEHTLSDLSKTVITLLLITIACLLSFYPLRSHLSEYYMRSAQLALSAGDSQRVYDLHLQTLTLSPNITNYQLSFADLNFRLASALSQKDELTDTDRETITRLVQTSIEHGKAAISLRPNDPRTWLTVAKIYQNLINVASGADKFALDTFSRAVSLDRANPELRLDYATLLLQLAAIEKDAERASSLKVRAVAEMQTAIQLKSDYSNAYYNLAKYYENDQDYPRAISALTETLKYLDENSSDYSRVSSELETLKTKPQTKPTSSPSPTPTPATESELSLPSPLPEPLDGGPIVLPTE